MQAYIVDYIRTPIGRYGGALASVRASGVGASARPPNCVTAKSWRRSTLSTLV